MIKEIFLTRNYILALTATFLQQAIVASSTLWIALLSKSIVAGEDYRLWLLLFLISLAIVYVPSSIAKLQSELAIFESLKNLIEKFDNQFFGLAGVRTNKEFKEKRQGYINNESWLVISEAIQFSVDWFSISLNVAFNIIVIGLSVDSRFLWAYLATLPFVALGLISNSKKIGVKTEASQSGRATMLRRLESAWDTILVGNQKNRDLWHRSFHSHHQVAKNNAFSVTLFIEVISSLSMILSLVPILGTLVWIFYGTNSSAALLAAVVATLPRQIQTLQNLSDIVLYSAHGTSVLTRVRGLTRAVTRPDNLTEKKGNVKWGTLTVDNQSLGSIEDIKSITKNYSSGRFTVRGQNGSGKSTLLAAIKENIQDSFMLPAHSQLFFKSTFNKSFSTGERLIQEIQEIKETVDEPIILLDEWDANLHQRNLEDISNMIDELAKNHCVIEVRHR